MCDEQWFVISVNSFWIRLERVALGVSVICKWTVNYNKFCFYFSISLTIDDFWLIFVAIFRAADIMEFYWNKLFANAYAVSMRIFWKLPQLWQYANQRNIIIANMELYIWIWIYSDTGSFRMQKVQIQFKYSNFFQIFIIFTWTKISQKFYAE